MSASDLQKIQTWIAQLSKKLDQKADKDEMDFKFERVYRQMQEGFAKVDERFSKVDERFAKIDERLEKMNDRIEDLTSAIIHQRAERETDLLLLKHHVLKIEADVEALKARHT